MKSLLLKAKKLIKAFGKLYNLDKKIKENLLIIDYEKSILQNNLENILIYKENSVPQIIVSLTTYNKRIYDVHLTIESLFRQTLMPNKIVLWLAEDEFNKDNIPYILKNLQKKGLEIGFCKDLKSYKKLIPTLKKYPEDIVITVDDDILYQYDLVENLYREYINDSRSVVCSRAHKYKVKNKRFLPYNEWLMEVKNTKENIFLTSGGGTLFPPKLISKEILNEELIFKLCPLADDVWINAILLKSNVKIKQIEDNRDWSEKTIILSKNQDIALCKVNVGQNQNDIQLKAVFDYYNLWEKLKDE